MAEKIGKMERKTIILLFIEFIDKVFIHFSLYSLDLQISKTQHSVRTSYIQHNENMTYQKK